MGLIWNFSVILPEKEDLTLENINLQQERIAHSLARASLSRSTIMVLIVNGGRSDFHVQWIFIL